MTEFPELQQALVDAARRRHRRARGAWRLTRPAVVIAAGAAALAVLALTWRAGDDERPAAPAGAMADPLAQRYAVFRRPATDADVLPDVQRIRAGLGGADGAAFDPSTARLVADEGGVQVFAAGAPMNGEPSICVFLVEDLTTDRYGCELIGTPTQDWQVAGSSWPRHGGAGDIFAAAVIDGIDEVELTFADGSRQSLAVHGNAVFAESPRPPVEVAWTDPDGRRRSEELPDRNPPGDPSP